MVWMVDNGQSIKPLIYHHSNILKENIPHQVASARMHAAEVYTNDKHTWIAKFLQCKRYAYLLLNKFIYEDLRKFREF